MKPGEQQQIARLLSHADAQKKGLRQESRGVDNHL